MATTGILNGTTMLLYVGGTAIAATTGHSMSLGVNMRDTTNKGSGGVEEVLPGVSNGSFSFDYLVAFDAAYGVKELFDLYISKAVSAMKFSSEVVGDPRFSANAYLETLDTDAPVEDNVTGSGTFRVTGGVTRADVT